MVIIRIILLHGTILTAVFHTNVDYLWVVLPLCGTVWVIHSKKLLDVTTFLPESTKYVSLPSLTHSVSHRSLGGWRDIYQSTFYLLTWHSKQKTFSTVTLTAATVNDSHSALHVANGRIHMRDVCNRRWSANLSQSIWCICWLRPVDIFLLQWRQAACQYTYKHVNDRHVSTSHCLIPAITSNEWQCQ